MKKRKVLIIAIAVLLLSSILVFVFRGSIFGSAKTSGIFNMETGPKTGPVGNWYMPIPDINPLGSQSLYARTEYENGDHYIKFVENYQESSRLFKGEKWTLAVADKSSSPLKFLKDYAKKAGAKIYSSPYSNQVVFSLEKGKEVMWWGDAKLSDEGYTLSVMKENYALPGKALTIKPKELGQGVNNVSFATTSKGNRFQTATVNLPSGEVKVTANLYMEKDVLTRKFDYTRELNSIKTSKFVLDDMPQSEGTLIWNISWEEGKAPDELSFLLQELQEIPVIKMGDEMGALKVSGIPFGDVRVEPQEYSTVEHADGYSLKGDVTPEGDTLFNLPAGYWNVILEAGGISITSMRSRLVPVNAGEMTVLTLPNDLKSTYSSLSSIYASAEGDAGGIEFLETKDLNDKASVSFVVNDPLRRDIYPTKENMKVVEGGKEVKILDITRQIKPPSIVLVLDSSGSMDKEMKNTLESAKKFMQSLPDQSFVQVIDFDSEIRVLNGTTRDEAAKDLASIKAGGATVLYDSVLQGLEIIKEKTRPALVVFSDGVDSSAEPGGGGSTATKEEVMEAVKEAKEAGVPLYTIGFGAGHDGTTLKEMADLSGGEYYPAKDQKALSNVFAAINSKFGNLFNMTYERPKEISKSDTPVVSIVIDNSGSMDTDPKEEEGCGYRIDKVKALFHDFVLKLTEECLVQMMKFHTGALGATIIDVEQLTNKRKPEFLQAIGEMSASNGTPILESIVAAYENLKPVPTTKKVIVYLTDAALEVSEAEDAKFVEILKNIKDDGIQVIWVGMGVEDKKEVFVRAAEISGGKYVISEDVKVLESTLAEVLSMINQPKASEKIPLSLSIIEKTTSGDIMSYSSTTNVKFAPPKSSGKALNPEKVETKVGTPLKRYDKEAAQLIYGTDLPSRDALITRRVPLNIKGSNKAMEIKAVEAYYLDIFKGIKKPDGKQYLAIDVEMKNITEQKIPYQIPSFTSHFYVNLNNKGMYPASEATWLAETPAITPGEHMLEIGPGQTQKGAMVFLVPDEPVTQKSLHFYDTENGHINVPLIGKMSGELLKINKMPTAQPVDITEAFSISVNGSSLAQKLESVEAAKDTSFKVIEADFKAKFQALLDIDPSLRLLLGIDTAQGPLLTKMSGVTAQLPFGFMKPVMLAPASNNTVRFAYQIPTALANTKTDIFGDLRDGVLQVPVTKGAVFGSPVNKPKLAGDGMEIVVNDLVRLNGIESFGDDYIAADVTIFDKKDGLGTTGFNEAFTLVRDDYNEKAGATQTAAINKGLGNFSSSGGSSEQILEPDSDDLLFGIDNDFAVFDNSSRRGLILFRLPDENAKKHSWTLRSPFFKDLKEPVRTGSYRNGGLLVYKTRVENLSDDFEKGLSEAINAAVIKYNATKAASGKAGYTKKVGLAKDEGTKNYIPVPAIVLSGTEKAKAVKTIDDFTKSMEKLKWLPSKDEPWHYRYSPEAVLTQGWGNEWDLANLAEGMLSKLGYKPYRRLVQLTEDGQKELMKLAGISECKLASLPAMAYTDEKGQSKLFVVPFMKDISKLDDAVYMTANQKKYDQEEQTVDVKISIKGEPKEKTAASQIGDAANVLAGGDGTEKSYEYIDIFSKKLSLASLSIDAIDVGYMKVGAGKGDIYKAAVDTVNGLIMSDGYVDTGECKVLGIKIEVSLPHQGVLTHETALLEKQKLDGLFHTVGINLPDLPKEAAESLQKAAELEHKAAKEPSTESAMKWYTRNILNRFITTQCEFDEKTGKELKVTLGRTSKARSIVVTMSINQKDKKLRTSVDLMQAANEVQSGDKKAQSAYNIGAGMFISQLEGRALPNGTKVELAEIWANVPKDTTMLGIGSDESVRSKAAEKMKDSGYPQILLEHIKDSEKMFIIPDKPAIIDGQKRWAWLEIDPKTYDTISVLETGGRSGTAEYVMNMMPSVKDCRDYIVGAFIGVETSVWAVAAFSLSLDDYDAILKNAMALVNSIADQIDYVMKNAKKPEIPDSVTVLEGSAGPVNFNMKIKWDLSIESATGHNFDIVNGFKDGAAFYFTHAKAATRKK